MSGLSVWVEVSPGALVDRITILEIKSERLRDRRKLDNVRRELAALVASRERALPAPPELDALTAELREVNADLWAVEDDLRACEARGEFGPGFVALARSVYRLNDRRAALKRRIDALLGARFRDEKQHPDY